MRNYQTALTLLGLVLLTTGCGNKNRNNYQIIPQSNDYRTTERVALYEAPDLDSRILLKRGENTLIRVTGTVKDTGWMQVGKYGLPTAYVQADKLKLESYNDKSDWEYRNYPNGSKYYGQLLNDRPHGYGFLYKDNSENNLHGESKPNEDSFDNDHYSNAIEKYSGEFYYGEYSGRGILEKSATSYGYVYNGDFSNGKIAGNGVLYEITSPFNSINILTSAKFYQGNFENGFLNGKGRMIEVTLGEPTYRTGTFKNNSLEGNGKSMSIYCLYSGSFNEDNYSTGKLFCDGGSGQTYEEGEVIKEIRNGVDKYSIKRYQIYDEFILWNLVEHVENDSSYEVKFIEPDFIEFGQEIFDTESNVTD